jgi:hypothetical protein
VKTKSDKGIGLADDPTTCAFCGLKVDKHSFLELDRCRSGLKSRIAAREIDESEVRAINSKKSASDRLNDVLTQISILEDRRKELLIEEAKEEARQDEEIHSECITDQDLDNAVEEARAEEREAAEEVWDHLRTYGGHEATCLSGALLGEKAPHALCTCGWNEVATQLERR